MNWDECGPCNVDPNAPIEFCSTCGWCSDPEASFVFDAICLASRLMMARNLVVPAARQSAETGIAAVHDEPR
jgi:hypothetical protein